MADRPSETKSFAKFLEEQPAPAETVTLVGYVARCARPGSFALTTGEQTMELPTDAVKSYKVLGEGPQQLVELEVMASKVDTKATAKSVLTDVVQKNPIFDRYTIKEVISDYISDKFTHKDPIYDPIHIPGGGVDPGPLAAQQAAGAQPFVLATPHHAPASTIATQMGTPAAAQHSTLPAIDLSTTAVLFDRIHTIKEIAKDPLFDQITLPESVIPDPTNTLVEGIGLPGGGQVINPAMQAQAYMAAVPQASLAQPATNAVVDTATISYFDHPHTSPWFDSLNTIKELVKDPITDPITIVENLPGGGGGTLQEGVAGGGPVTYPVWNLPGMMF